MQKETGTNEQTNTDALDPYDLLKTKRVLISKEQKKTDIKKKKT